MTVDPFTRLSEHAWMTTADTVAPPLNIGLIVGIDKALIIDPGPADGTADGTAQELIDQVRAVTQVPFAVVLTHGHQNHAGLTTALLDAGATSVYAHPKAYVQAATDLISDTHTLELGGVQASIEYLGRGHTESDLIVRVPAADDDDVRVLFCGDLIREGSDPGFSDSYPKEWVRVLGKVYASGEGRAKYVPGHGRPVDKEFIAAMRKRMLQAHGVSAQAIRDSVSDATKAIPIIPYGIKEARQLITRLRGH